MGPVGEKHSRMRWLWGLCLTLAVFTVVTAKPAQPNYADLNLESEFIAELLTNLLVPSEREGRQIDEEQDEEEVGEVAEAEMAEVEGEAMEDSEALKEAKKVEVSRFNNYIDAIYRRMNAALKAKLMDPMELNLDEKAKKNEGKKGKSEKTRVLREAIDEDDDSEIDVSRIGKAAKTEKRAGKFKGMSKEERLAEKKKRKLRKQKKNDAKEKKKEMEEKKMEMKEKKMDAKEKKKEMKEKKMEMKAKKSKEPKEKKMEAKRKRKNKDARESRSNRRNKDKKKGQNKNKNKARNNNKKKKKS